MTGENLTAAWHDFIFIFPGNSLKMASNPLLFSFWLWMLISISNLISPALPWLSMRRRGDVLARWVAQVRRPGRLPGLFRWVRLSGTAHARTDRYAHLSASNPFPTPFCLVIYECLCRRKLLKDDELQCCWWVRPPKKPNFHCCIFMF